MRYVFFGTPEFAARILAAVIRAGFAPAALVASPDRPAGRKQILSPPKTKIVAQAHGIPVFQPETPGELQPSLEEIAPEFFVVAAYAKILPLSILRIPPRGAIGLHPSLLPKYRGTSPIQSAILSGEKETGVTLYLLDEKVDHGPIIASTSCSIEDQDTYATLLLKLADLGGALLAATLPRFEEGGVSPLPQDERLATYTKKFSVDHAFVSADDLKGAESGAHPEKAALIWRKIRALNPEPGTWTLRQAQGKQKRVKLLEAVIEDGRLRLTVKQEAGRKPVLLGR